MLLEEHFFFNLKKRELNLSLFPAQGIYSAYFSFTSLNSSPKSQTPPQWILDIILFCPPWEANHWRLHYPSSFASWFLVTFAQREALAGQWGWSGRGWGIFPPYTCYFEQHWAMVPFFLIVSFFRDFLGSGSAGVPLILFSPVTIQL